MLYEESDLVVLGSGEGGKFIAWSLASQGKPSAVGERRYVGGSCPNIACLPSKNVIRAAKVADFFRRGTEFGIAPGDWKVEMSAVRDRKRRMVDGLVAIHHEKYRESVAELVMGQSHFVGPRSIEVATADGGTRTLRGDVVLMSTGSRADRPDSGPRRGAADDARRGPRIGPRPGAPLGPEGGFVGLELAQALRRFGSRVTVIERNDALAHREDRDVSEALWGLFDDEGIEVRTGTRVDRMEGWSGESVRLHATRDGAEDVIEGSDLLVASGRTPNTDGIGLEAAGVERDDRGFVKVDERLRTTAPGMWAVGDCAGSPHFTHIACDDFRVVRDNLAGIAARRPAAWCPPACSPTPSWPGSV